MTKGRNFDKARRRQRQYRQGVDSVGGALAGDVGGMVDRMVRTPRLRKSKADLRAEAEAAFADFKSRKEAK